MPLYSHRLPLATDDLCHIMFYCWRKNRSYQLRASSIQTLMAIFQRGSRTKAYSQGTIENARKFLRAAIPDDRVAKNVVKSLLHDYKDDQILGTINYQSLLLFSLLVDNWTPSFQSIVQQSMLLDCYTSLMGLVQHAVCHEELEIRACIMRMSFKSLR